MLKTRQFAAVQREQARNNANKKDKNNSKNDKFNEDEPDAFVNTHAITKFKSQTNLQAQINERDSESEYSHLNQETEEEVLKKQETERRQDIITMFKRIDQTSLSQIGLSSK